MPKYKVRLYRAVAETKVVEVEARNLLRAHIEVSDMLVDAGDREGWEREVLKHLPPKMDVKEIRDNGEAAA